MPHIKDVLDTMYGDASVDICYAAPRHGRCELEKILAQHGYNPLGDLSLLREIEIQRMCEGTTPLLLADSNWKAQTNLSAWEVSQAVLKLEAVTIWDDARLYLLRQEHLGKIIRSFHIDCRRDFVCPGHSDGTRLYCDLFRDENLRIAHYYDLGLLLGDGVMN